MLPKDTKAKNRLVVLALFLGAIIFKLAQRFCDRIAEKMHGLRKLSGLDEMFLTDPKYGMTTCTLRFEKFDFQTMSDYLKENLPIGIPLARKRLVQYYGNHYWKPISIEEVHKIWPKCCIEVKDVRNKEQLQTFIAKVMDEGFDVYSNTLPFMAYLIPETDDGYGYVVLLETHAQSDGMQYMAAIVQISNFKDLSKGSQHGRVPFSQRIMAELMTPIGYVRVLRQLFSMPIQDNCIKGPFEADQQSRQFRISKDFHVPSIKKVSKKLGATITEICQSMVGQTIKEYDRRHGTGKLSEITVISTFSTKQIPTKMEDIIFGNHFVPLFMTLPVTDDLKTVLNKSKHNIRDYVGSNKIKGAEKMISSFLNLPYNLGKYPFGYMTQQNSLRMSSCPGPRTPMYYGKYKCDAIMCGMPKTSWTYSPAITFNSLGDYINMSFITNSNCIQYPDDFMSILTQKFDAFIDMGDQIEQKMIKKSKKEPARL